MREWVLCVSSKHQESLYGEDEDVSGGSGQRFCSNGKGLAGSPPRDELFELWRSESQRSTVAAKLFLGMYAGSAG